MYCPICQNRQCDKICVRKFSQKSDEQYPIVRCNNCSHVFLDRDFTQDELNELYSCYYPRGSFNPAKYKAHTEKSVFMSWIDGDLAYAFRHVPPNVRVLDIGCGSCESLGYHQKRGCDVYGIETDANVAVIAEAHRFNVHIGPFQDGLFEKESFDYITMDHVLEHVKDPVCTLKSVRALLISSEDAKKSGKFIAAFPFYDSGFRKIFGRRWIGWHTPFHLQFYSQKSLAIMAEAADMSIEKMQLITLSRALLSQFGQFLVPEKKIHSLKYRNNEMYESDARKRSSLVFMYNILLKCRSSAPIARMLDLSGMGHCMVVTMIAKH